MEIGGKLTQVLKTKCDIKSFCVGPLIVLFVNSLSRTFQTPTSMFVDLGFGSFAEGDAVVDS